MEIPTPNPQNPRIVLKKPILTNCFPPHASDPTKFFSATNGFIGNTGKKKKKKREIGITKVGVGAQTFRLPLGKAENEETELRVRVVRPRDRSVMELQMTDLY